jgi:DNA-directed RNA polymerase sigma subunit (sigma70/sigma32)
MPIINLHAEEKLAILQEIISGQIGLMDAVNKFGFSKTTLTG